ncbi:Na+/H+ antiporter NhaA [Chitinophaga caseinilytica]|uniref:Na+/H+ antiporter NhaA n=1 Tax=Chitinophaga caseinilytica TaxID=2267521 RepID=UPI003C2F69BE
MDALLAGVGLTMSLFITGLVFNDPEMFDQSTYRILPASVISGVAGIVWLREARKHTKYWCRIIARDR